MLLADLGADVVRIDRPSPAAWACRWRREDDVNGARPPLGGAGPEVARRPRGALRLVARADVLIEGFRPGVPSAWAWARRTAMRRATRAWSTAA
jgi:alpha-methylacyl-CoA racemase